MTIDRTMHSGTLAANIAVHSAMAKTYNDREPHFRPENRRVVRGLLEALRKEAGRGQLLDVGCGTGFILGLAHDLFDELHGVDITPEMLQRVDLTPGNIKLHHGRCEELPFADETFRVATAYSVLDHLENYDVVLREIGRVLEPGGIFYADLIPNRAFWSAIDQVVQSSVTSSPWVAREVEMFLRQSEMVESEYGVSRDAFIAAEPWKNPSRGISAEELRECGMRAGFADCQVTYEWFLGQGAILHGEGESQTEAIRRYLYAAMPLTQSLFKYLRVIMRK